MTTANTLALDKLVDSDNYTIILDGGSTPWRSVNLTKIKKYITIKAGKEEFPPVPPPNLKMIIW